ncbi:response regulator transcription factor [Brevibacillus sp. H7]|uniref:response regulator transcription factor n=1 Tax=Brevibacillus sp. H7 TaxID=3349138 RepID=UPI0038020E37
MTTGLYVSSHPLDYSRLREQLKAYSLDLVKEQALEVCREIQFIIIDSAGTRNAPLVARYRSAYPHAFILVLSVKRDEEDLLEAFASGADDYQLKPCSEREVATRIRVMLRRKITAQEPDPNRFNADVKSRSMEWKSIRRKLTRLECRLLDSLLSSNKIISREQLVQSIWDGQMKASGKVLDVHIFNLRKKLLKATGGEVTIKTVTNKGFYLCRNHKQ